MKTRTLGRTGMEISELVLGAGWVGGLFLDQDRETMASTLDRAVSAGVSWIDTAQKYGDGASERNVGELVRQLPPDGRPGISTKVSLDRGRSENIASQIDRAIDGSLDRLGLDRVALYQLHNPLAASGDGRHLTPAEVLQRGGVAETLHRLRDDGRIGAVGLTALGETGPLLAVIETGLFDTAQVYYNMLDPSAALPSDTRQTGQGFHGLLDACVAQRMGILNIRVLAAGILATDTRHGREVAVTANADLARETRLAQLLARELGTEHGDRAQTAVRYGLSEERMSCVVLGLAEPDHLELALEAVERGPLPEDVLDRIRHLQQREFDRA